MHGAPGDVEAPGVPAAEGIYLGTSAGRWLWAGAERSALVLGPSRAGKTSSVVIPNILVAAGAVISTSTKPDVLAATGGARRRVGHVGLYDPSGTVEPPPGVERIGWSPVAGSDDWTHALLTADAMVRAARPTGPGDHHWSERAGALLATLLHAGALDARPMSVVLSWVDRHDGRTALAVLSQEVGPEQTPTNLLAGILATDQREQSGIWSTASGTLAAYRSPAALASTEGPFVDLRTFCAGPNTLYVCATGREQQFLAPLVVGLLADVRDAAYRRARRGERTPAVLFALDEVANIAPIPDLPSLVSEGGGQGVLTLACLQDLSQARVRWGRHADGFLSLFSTTIVLGGVADVATLEALGALAGHHEVASVSATVSSGRLGRRSHTRGVSAGVRPRLTAAEIARGRAGSALVVDARKRLGWIGLTPAHEVTPWNELLAGPPSARGRRIGRSGQSTGDARSLGP
jgi:type IV secretory pathway TraG/TraD family ATPase VirD4